ncbi:MAG: hypothetical protein WA937_15505 [Flavobacteriales bacterium]
MENLALVPSSKFATFGPAMSHPEHLEQILAVLTDAALPRILKELTLCAEYELRLKNDQGETRQLGLTGEDIAHDALEKVLTGKWKWNPERAPLLPYLKTQVIPGLVSNLVGRMEIQLGSSVEADNTANPLNSSTPIDELYAKEVLIRIANHIAGDEQVEQVFKARGDGLTRSEACKAYHLPTKDYDNATKRLDRKIHDLICEKDLKRLR